MEQEIKIFESPQFGQIRTAGTPDEPKFCLSDVCAALDLTAKGVNQRLEDGVISTYPIYDRFGRTQQALFVNEDGLYDVIFESRKPEARAFRKWVTSEVLPTIRNAEHDAENEQIQIFENPQLGTIRTAGTSENPLFCLLDICKILDLRTDAVRSRLKDDPIRIGVIDSMGRRQTALFVDEKNLYKVIMRSDKPQAEAFQDWVCGDVLPTIRKTGKYEVVSNNPIDNSPAVAEMQSKIDRLQSTVDELVLLVRELKAQKPKAIGNSRLVFGIFQPGEQIQMSDKRLYEGSAAPFRNYMQMWRAKRKGCPFRTPNTIRQWSIKAEDLEYWLTSNPRPMK